MKHHIGLYIETPEPDLWPDEIAKVKMIAEGQLEWIENEHRTHFKSQVLKKFAHETASSPGLF